MTLSPPSRRVARGLGITFATALATAALALGSTAQAATTPSHLAPTPHTATAPAVAVGTSATANSHSHAIRPDTVSCSIAPEWPDGPTQYGDIEGYAYVSCTGVVYAIQEQTAIYNNSTGQGGLSSWDTQYNTTGASGQALAPLTPGYWQTCGVAYVWWTSTSYSEIGGCSLEIYFS